MPSHTNPKVSLGASVPVASSRFQSVIRHFSELGILPQVVKRGSGEASLLGRQRNHGGELRLRESRDPRLAKPGSLLHFAILVRGGLYHEPRLL